MYKITKDRRKEMLLHFFRSVRMWINIDSPRNEYDDTQMWYSLDQNKFLKRHERNRKATYNWVLINHNKYKLRYLKHNLNIRNKEELTFDGRLVNNIRVKDDLFLEFIEFVTETFDEFFNNNVINEETKTTTKSKKLF